MHVLHTVERQAHSEPWNFVAVVWRPQLRNHDPEAKYSDCSSKLTKAEINIKLFFH
jgi:hypothetical protein